MSLTALAAILEHSRRNVPYYASRLSSSADLETDPLGALEKLPLLSRQEVRSEKARLVAAEVDASRCHLVRSTGTTGVPVEIVQDSVSRMMDMTLLGRLVDSLLGAGSSQSLDLLYLTLHDGALSRAMPSAWSPLCRVMKWNLLRAWQRGSDGFLQSLSALSGRVVTALPSVADLLAARVLAAGTGQVIRPAVVLLSGEHLESDARNRLVDAFCCPVAEMYALSEVGLTGTECPTGGGFHTGPVAWVEIIGEDGCSVGPGAEGEVVLSTLCNRIMPLLRYRTGDRAVWLPGACGCGNQAARFKITSGRRPSRLVSSSSATINVVRFAKLLAGLDVNQIRFDSDGPGKVCVGYSADRILGPAPRSIICSAVWSALGPDAIIRFEHGLPIAASQAHQTPTAVGVRVEPDRPPVAEIAHWLRGELEDAFGLMAAVLVGSSLEPEATTRFSDLDLVLLFDHSPAAGEWTVRGRALALRVPGLSLVPDHCAGLERRSPLLACRLLSEGVLVTGSLRGLPTPSSLDLRSQANFWLQEAAAILWSRLTSPLEVDVIEQAWTATKLALGALRFHLLCRGVTSTAAIAVMELAADEFGDLPWFHELRYALSVAREHVPPPPETTGYRYLVAAKECVDVVFSARLTSRE